MLRPRVPIHDDGKVTSTRPGRAKGLAMPNYEDFKRYGEMEKQKKPSAPPPGDEKRPRESWLSKSLSALRGNKKS